MNDELISVIDVASQLGKRKQTIFKVIKRLAIETKRMSSPDHRGATLLYVTNDDAQLIRDELAPVDEESDESEDGYDLSTGATASEQGVFYLLLLETEHDVGRFKVGFATNLSDRLRTLRCSAPFARVVKSWPCKQL
jgi:hypothetical protein